MGAVGLNSEQATTSMATITWNEQLPSFKISKDMLTDEMLKVEIVEDGAIADLGAVSALCIPLAFIASSSNETRITHWYPLPTAQKPMVRVLRINQYPPRVRIEVITHTA